jgi:hypothetical protein
MHNSHAVTVSMSDCSAVFNNNKMLGEDEMDIDEAETQMMLDAAIKMEQSEAMEPIKRKLVVEDSDSETDAKKQEMDVVVETGVKIQPGILLESKVKAEPRSVALVKSEGINAKISDQDWNFIDQLKIYYQRLFPFKEFYHWLSYGNGS